MTDEQALEIVVSRTKHERFRHLCREDNPDLEQRDRYRDMVRRMAEGASIPPPPKALPPARKMMATAAIAAAGFAASGFKLASKDERDRRKSICSACPEYSGEKGRCLKCGCFINLKSRIEAEKCPIGRWEANGPPSSPPS